MTVRRPPIQDNVSNKINRATEAWTRWFIELKTKIDTLGGEGDGRTVNVSRVTTSTTLDATYYNVFFDTDSGNLICTLPSGMAGTQYRIVNTGTSGNQLTITPDGSELLLGANSNFTLNDGESLIIVYEDTEGWF